MPKFQQNRPRRLEVMAVQKATLERPCQECKECRPVGSKPFDLASYSNDKFFSLGQCLQHTKFSAEMD